MKYTQKNFCRVFKSSDKKEKQRKVYRKAFWATDNDAITQLEQ